MRRRIKTPRGIVAVNGKTQAFFIMFRQISMADYKAQRKMEDSYAKEK